MKRWIKENHLNIIIALLLTASTVCVERSCNSVVEALEPVNMESMVKVQKKEIVHNEAHRYEPVVRVVPEEEVDIPSEDQNQEEEPVEESEENEEPDLVSLGEFKLTAYCSCEKCCGKWAKCRPVDENGNQIVMGASGAVLEEGRSIAVDPEVIPYGTKVYVNGCTYVAEDCGGAIKGNRIDVYFSTHQSARDFAIQYGEVFIEKGE